MKGGKERGKGACVWKRGQPYMGSWEHGEHSGRGTYIFVDKSDCDGSWKDETETPQSAL